MFVLPYSFARGFLPAAQTDVYVHSISNGIGILKEIEITNGSTQPVAVYVYLTKSGLSIPLMPGWSVPPGNAKWNGWKILGIDGMAIQAYTTGPANMVALFADGGLAVN